MIAGVVAGLTWHLENIGGRMRDLASHHMVYHMCLRGGVTKENKLIIPDGEDNAVVEWRRDVAWYRFDKVCRMGFATHGV